MKLEITHIAPYLPYGLMVQTSWSIDGFGGLCTSKAVGIYHEELLLEPHTILHKHIPYRISIDRASLDDPDTKPLLLPMSSLYTEMEDGTVPIVEIIHLLCGADTSDIKNAKVIKYNTDGYKVLYNSVVDKKKWFAAILEYSNGNWALSWEEELTSFNQVDLFTYLFSHHFDVYSLIDNGLAIDKTKIK